MARRRTTPAGRPRTGRIIGYVRVSTGEQAGSGLGLEAQRTILRGEAARRGAELDLVEDAGRSGKSLDRPGLGYALAQLADGAADALVVAKLDRLSRSVADFAGLLALSRDQGWDLVALDLGVDTSTPTGKLVAGVMMQVAEWERDVIADRTRAALGALREQGRRVGRPVLLPAEVRERIATEHAEGRSLRAIARDLTEQEVPTAQGGAQWYASTVSAVLESIRTEQELAAARRRARDTGAEGADDAREDLTA